MGRYRVNVECSQKLPQTKSEYFTHCSYEVQAYQQGRGKGHGRGQSPGRARGLYLQGLQRGGAEVSRPENMTPDEAEIWQRMELHGEELVRDMGAALMQADKLPEWMQEAAVNMLCDKLADARALAASWMNDHGEP